MLRWYVIFIPCILPCKNIIRPPRILSYFLTPPSILLTYCRYKKNNVLSGTVEVDVYTTVLVGTNYNLYHSLSTLLYRL